MVSYYSYGQTKYETKVSSAQVKSLQVKIADQLISDPLIELNGGEFIEINFDILNHTQGRYAYTIIHCDADWNKSNLLPLEYMEGFQGMTIDDYAQSINTMVNYKNYRLFLPNEDLKFKISGNYIIKVYEEDSPDKTLFTAKFAVYESLILLKGSYSGNTDISFNKDYQQLLIELDHKNFPIAFPQSDLKIFIYQNHRMDNFVTDLKPMITTANRIIYQHQPQLIFEAGNEYRRIEFLTHRYNGMRIDKIQYFNPYYHADIQTDHSRARQSYQYDEDQDGRFFIRCSNCQDPDIESDYYIVHFTYVSEKLANGDIYLQGDAFQNQFSDENRLEYNVEMQQYEKAMLLKQGNYNYQYLFVRHGENIGTSAYTEGNYYQTKNNYVVLAYYRAPGGRFDRLIGKLTIIE